MCSIIYLSLVSAIIGALAAYIPIILGCRRLPNAVDQMISENEAESLLDEELDQLILTFQQEIPMASTFLKGSLLDRLKMKARTRLMGLFPKIKNRFNYKLAHTLLPKIKNEARKAALMGAAIGLIGSMIASLLYTYMFL
jgi:hypothetical protein